MARPLSSLATAAEKAVGLETLRVLGIFDGVIADARKSGTLGAEADEYEKFINSLKASHVANVAKRSATVRLPEVVDPLYTIAEERHLESKKGAAANQGHLKLLDALETEIKSREKASEIFSPTTHVALGRAAEEDLSRS